MCARYTMTKAEKDILKQYNVKIPNPLEPNYNLAPTQNGLVITADEPDIAQQMHFGLVPFWAADTKLNISTLNARSEEVLNKKTYAPLIIKHKTCLVLADSFYEWDRKSGKSLPYRFVLNDRELFAFPGLWSQWKSKDGNHVYRSFTIMTTKANETVGKVHDPKFRMPVILHPDEEMMWLDKTLSVTDRLKLCVPYPDDQMHGYRVSTAMNAASIKGVVNNNSELLLPLNSN
ncbi:SOS response-associated peptidase [Pedobacter antarcticus]|uniref:SOS response-associated peptidase n=1 Tax=Pedobacter antarcticus TaxID=34086 RepID=UPI002930AC96|nr:SOS response-associated peptidase [Pedobacter antarcticus]